MSFFISSLRSEELDSLTTAQKVLTGAEVAVVVSLVVFGILGLTEFSHLFPQVNALSWGAVSVGAAVTILELASLGNLIRKRRGQVKEEEIVVEPVEIQDPQPISEVTYGADGKLLIPQNHLETFKATCLVFFDHIKPNFKRPTSELPDTLCDFKIKLQKRFHFYVSVVEDSANYVAVLESQGVRHPVITPGARAIYCVVLDEPEVEKTLARSHGNLDLPIRMGIAAIEKLINANDVFPDRKSLFETLLAHYDVQK